MTWKFLKDPRLDFLDAQLSPEELGHIALYAGANLMGHERSSDTVYPYAAKYIDRILDYTDATRGISEQLGTGVYDKFSEPVAKVLGGVITEMVSDQPVSDDIHSPEARNRRTGVARANNFMVEAYEDLRRIW